VELCTPIGDGASSTDDFLLWFKSEVATLPEIFAGANKIFVSIALKGVLQRVSVVCRTTISPAAHEVRKTLRRITKDWWRLFGNKEAIFVARTKLHEVDLIRLASYY
jgi:hypothetical protein